MPRHTSMKKNININVYTYIHIYKLHIQCHPYPIAFSLLIHNTRIAKRITPFYFITYYPPCFYQYDQMGDDIKRYLKYINAICTGLFTIEMAIKMTGLGLRVRFFLQFFCVSTPQKIPIFRKDPQLVTLPNAKNFISLLPIWHFNMPRRIFPLFLDFEVAYKHSFLFILNEVVGFWCIALN